MREVDVLLLLLDELQKGSRYDDAALRRLRSAFAQEHAPLHARLRSRMAGNTFRRAPAKIAKAAEQLKGDDRRGTTPGWRWAIEARVSHRAAALKAAIESAGAVYLPDRVHVVRITLKKLRYAVEVARDVSTDTRFADAVSLLRRVQLSEQRLHAPEQRHRVGKARVG